MNRFYRSRVSAWRINAPTWAVVIAMVLQACYVPELLAQQAAEQARINAHLLDLRAERTQVDRNAPAYVRQQQTANRASEAVARAADAASAQRDEAYTTALDDLAVLRENILTNREALHAQFAAARAILANVNVQQNVRDHVEKMVAQVDAALAEQLSAIDAARGAGSDPLERERTLGRLRRAIHGVDPMAAGTRAPELPRKIQRARAVKTGLAPLFSSNWQFADGANEVITDLLQQAGAGVIGQPDPNGADTAVSEPDVVFVTPSGQGTPTDPIAAKAVELGKDPVRIYEFVRNDIVYEPYFGASKGAARTLAEGRGNDADTASLMIALLRASGVPARYVFGTIELPSDIATAWLGVSSVEQALKLLQRAAIPVEADYAGGVIAKLRVDHIWVKAYIDAFPYRGAGRLANATNDGDAWAEFAPAFKQHTIIERPLELTLGIDPSSTLANAQQPPAVVTVNQNQNAVGNLDRTILNTQLSALAIQTQRYLASQNLRSEVAFRQRVVRQERLGVAPFTDHFKVVARGLNFRRLPDVLRHYVTITLQNPDGSQIISHRRAVSELAGLPITVSYTPASGFDAILNAPAIAPEQGTLADQDNFPAYLMLLHTRLRIGTTIAAETTTSAADVQMGARQRLRLLFDVPGYEQQVATDDLNAGGVHALVLNDQVVTAADLAASQAALTQIAANVDASNNALNTFPPSSQIDLSIGRALHGLGQAYFHQADRVNQVVAGSLGVLASRQPSMARLSWDVRSVAVGGVPMNARADLLSFAVPRDVYVAAASSDPPTGSVENDEERFAFLSGLAANAVEATTLPQAVLGLYASAATRVIELANAAASNPIVTVRSANVQNVLAQSVALSIPVEARIRDEALAGREVTFNAVPVTPSATSGPVVAMLLRDVDSGDSGYVLLDANTGLDVHTNLDIQGTSGFKIPKPADLIRARTATADDRHRYIDATNAVNTWVSTIEPITTGLGVWMISAAADMAAWYRGRVGMDPVTPVMSTLAVVVAIVRTIGLPSIINVSARSGRDDTAKQNWVRLRLANETTPFGPDVFRVQGDVTRLSAGDTWTITVRKQGQSGNVATASFGGSSIVANICFGTVPNGLTNPIQISGTNTDGVYTYTLEATNASGVAVPVVGTFYVDRTPPSAPNLAVDDVVSTIGPGPNPTIEIVRGEKRVRGIVDDVNLESADISVFPVSGCPNMVSQGSPIFTLTRTQSALVTPQGQPVLGQFSTRAVASSYTHVRATIAVRDIAGNVTSEIFGASNVECAGAQINNPDVIPPTATLALFGIQQSQPITNTDPYYEAKVRATVTATDTASAGNTPGIRKLEILVDNRVVDTKEYLETVLQTTVTNSFDVPLFVLGSGVHTLAARATDAAGNTTLTTAQNLNYQGLIVNYRVNPAVATSADPEFLATAGLNLNGIDPNQVNGYVYLEDSTGQSWRYYSIASGSTSIHTQINPGADSSGQLAVRDGQYSVRVELNHPQLMPGGAYSTTVSLPVEVNLFDQGRFAVITNLAAPVSVHQVPPQGLDTLRSTVIRTGDFDLYGIAVNDTPSQPVRYMIEVLTRSDAAEPTFVAVPPLAGQSYWVVQPKPVAPSSVCLWKTSSTGLAGQPDGTGDLLAHLDLSGIPNGVYFARLTVAPEDTNNPCSEPYPGNTEYTTRRFVLQADHKAPDFEFTEKDLVVHTAGVPITVSRTYKSSKTHIPGPFGAGWSLGLSTPQVQLSERRASTNELGICPETGSSAISSLRTGDNFDRDVTITLPNGEEVTFTFGFIPEPEPDGIQQLASQAGLGQVVFRADYESPESVTAKLETIRPVKFIDAPLLPAIGTYWVDPVSGGYGSPLEAYDIPGWILRMDDGSVYTIVRDPVSEGGLYYNCNGGQQLINIGNVYGPPYVSQVDFPNGDSIVYKHQPENYSTYDNPPQLTGVRFLGYVPDNMNHPQQVETRALGLVYAQHGNDQRVKAIYGADKWPRGSQSPDVNKAPDFLYEYDPDPSLDRLIKVHRVRRMPLPWDPATDQIPASNPGVVDYETTEYLYPENVTQVPLALRIEQIKDPRGLSPVRMEYDEAGRLVATIDAFGRRTEMRSNIALRTEVISDRSTPPNQTVNFFDEHGNLIRTVEPTGRTTDRIYDARRLLIEEAVNGRRTATYEYNDPFYNQTFRKDATDREFRTSYEYYPNSRVIQQMTEIDPDNSTKITRYDAQARVTSIEQGRSRTLFEYDAVTRLMSTQLISEANNDGTWTDPRIQQTFTYDPYSGQMRELRQVNGNVDPAGGPVGGDPADFRQFFGYDTAGNQVWSAVYGRRQGQPANEYAVDWVRHDGDGRPIEKLRQYVSTLPPSAFDTPATPADPIIPGGATSLEKTIYSNIGEVLATVRLRDAKFNYDAGNTNNATLVSMTTFRYDALGQNIETAEWNGVNDADRTAIIGFISGGTAPNWQVLPTPIVSRTVYDEEGREIYESDPFPYANYPNAPTSGPGSAVPCGNKTDYDGLGRVIATRRVSGLSIAIAVVNGSNLAFQSAATVTGGVYESNTTTYDYYGNVNAVADVAGNQTIYSYDDEGRKISETNARNEQMLYQYDGAGRLLRMRDARQFWTSYQYDGSGRRTHTTFEGNASGPSDDLTLTTYYDAQGRHVGDQDAMGHRKTLNYDTRGRLISVNLPAVQSPSGATVSPTYTYSRDAMGNLLSIQDPASTLTGPSGPATAFQYDIYNRQIRRTLPDGSSFETAAFDDFSMRMTEHTDVHTSAAGSGNRAVNYYHFGKLARTVHYKLSSPSTPERTVTYTYDLWDRLMQVSVQDNGVPAARTTNYEYENNGRLWRVQSPEGVIEYGYDTQTGRHTSTRVIDGSASIQQTTNYTYDEVGRLRTVERNGQTYTYDYNANGSRSGITYPNGARSLYTYDEFDRLITLEHRRPGANGTLETRYRYTPRPDGRRSSVLEERFNAGGSLTDSFRVDYTYDDAGRLAREQSSIIGASPALPPARFVYTLETKYDLNGNRIELKTTNNAGAITTRTYQVDLNDRLTAEVVNGVTVVSYTYWDNGALRTRTEGGITTTYGNDVEGRVASVSVGAGPAVAFTYDHTGVRTRAIGNGRTQYFLVDQQNHSGYAQVLQDRSVIGSSPTVTRNYIIGIEPLGQHGANTSSLQNLMFDGHGSTRLLTNNSTNAIDQRYDYDASGNLLDSSLNLTAMTSQLYCNEQYDTSMGMYYLRARYYDPRNGRFASADPFAGINKDPQSLHKYAYCHDDPVNAKDPSGLFSLTEMLVVIRNQAARLAEKGRKLSKVAIQVMRQAFRIYIVLTLSLGFSIERVAPYLILAYPYGLKLLRDFNKQSDVAVAKRLRRFIGVGLGKLGLTIAEREVADIPIKANGQPEFGRWVASGSTVFIILTGSRSSDNTESRRVRQLVHGRSRDNVLHTWHHHDIPGIMELVSTPVHAAVQHIGGANVWSIVYDKKYK